MYRKVCIKIGLTNKRIMSPLRKLWPFTNKTKKLPKYSIPVELLSLFRFRIPVQLESYFRITEKSLEIFNFLLKTYYKKNTLLQFPSLLFEVHCPKENFLPFSPLLSHFQGDDNNQADRAMQNSWFSLKKSHLYLHTEEMDKTVIIEHIAKQKKWDCSMLKVQYQTEPRCSTFHWKAHLWLGQSY